MVRELEGGPREPRRRKIRFEPSSGGKEPCSHPSQPVETIEFRVGSDR
jgi:hypothetical protein